MRSATPIACPTATSACSWEARCSACTSGPRRGRDARGTMFPTVSIRPACGRPAMRTVIVLLMSLLLLSPLTADAQDSRAALEAAAKALGATDLKSIEIQGAGTFFWVGQSYTAGTPWPEF